MSKIYGAIEAGGTTWVLALAVGDYQNIQAQTEIPTTTPEETLSKALKWFQSNPLQLNVLTIASFGPLDLHKTSPSYGSITTTPKPNWKNTNLVEYFSRAYDNQLPIYFETDVNAPALYLHLKLKKRAVCYITLGTGVGVGIASNQQAVHGYMHPEAGHVFVPLHEEDLATKFKGGCPYHGYCVEGMVASNAISQRTNIDRHDLSRLQDDDKIWEILGYYIGFLCVNLTLVASPELIVIGGGISKRGQVLFIPIRETLKKHLNGYVDLPDLDEYIVPAFKYSSNIGLESALFLAQNMLD